MFLVVRIEIPIDPLAARSPFEIRSVEQQTIVRDGRVQFDPPDPSNAFKFTVPWSKILCRIWCI